MRPVIGLVRRHDLPIGRLPMDFGVEIGEGGTQGAVEGAHSGLVGGHIWLWRVVDKIVGEKFLE